jgi:hypothetical protein
MQMLRSLARVRGYGIRFIEGYGVAVLYSITPEEHIHITYKTPYTFYGTKPYKIKESVLESFVTGLVTVYLGPIYTI